MQFDININTVILLIVSVLTLITTFIARRTEKNTNSMKDELVKATAELHEAKGRKDMKEEMEEKDERSRD